MKLRPWMIDVAVWAVLSVTMLGLLYVVVQLTLPPTPQQLQARFVDEARNVCLAHPETAKLIPDMREDVCGCMANRANTAFGGLDQRDFEQCRMRVAMRMNRHPDVDSVFASSFPAACAQVERNLSGRKATGNTPFCGCLREQVAAVPVAKSAYAFAGGEPSSSERDARFRACAPMLVFGEGWKTTGGGIATMQLPPLLPFRQMTLRCVEGDLRLEVLDGTLPIGTDVTFMEETDPNPLLRSASGLISGRDAYTLTDKLMLRSEFEIWIEGGGYGITLDGFRGAADAVLAACPEDVPNAPTPAITAELLDVWQTADAGHAYIPASLTSEWWGSLVCDWPPPYMTLQGPIVQRVIERFPDPAGERLAATVPLEIVGDGQVLFAEETFCDHGVNEGDTESCFVVLDRERMDGLFASAMLSVQLGGERLEPVAFGGSSAIQDARPMCYRALED